MHVATLVLIILSAGIASQWLAAQLKIPAIVVLIASGVTLGPITGVIELGLSQTEISELIGLGVAIILFEGGMDLKLSEFRRVGRGIRRLTILGPPVGWLFGGLAAHYIAGLSWPVAWVLGAILVVTGPTVILPLLRQAKLNQESASLLKWEGIVNDPIGVLLAVLTFQYFTLADTGWVGAISGMGAAIFAAALFGGLGGWITGWLYRRGSVPVHLKAPMLMVLVLIAYWASNLIQHEAGLLTVTVMGVVIGNMNLVERESLQHFKENLTVILLSVLFIIIPSQLKFSQLDEINWQVLLFVLVVLLVVRPLTIFLTTLGGSIRKQDKLLLAWVAPRGIVAAASAGIFGPALVSAGYADAEKLLPIVFLIIIVTVLAHGLTLGKLARKLGLAAQSENGLLIIGASRWTQVLAQALKKLNIDVLVADGAYHRLKALRMDGTKIYYGELLSEHARHELEIEHLSHLLAATDNDYYNALVCKAQGNEFGHHRTFQFAIHKESNQAQKRLSLQQRGYGAFNPDATFEALHQWLDDGWTMQTTKLSESFGFDKLKERLGEPGNEWLLIGGLSSQGKLWLQTAERSLKLTAGTTLLYFAPKNVEKELKNLKKEIVETEDSDDAEDNADQATKKAGE
ncbi:cation:proton antiporter [Lacimicrobium alkaliphilum]|uniref:Sodium/hydrogen exchanger n=1 Tax=Lacimicrobium alkaliphilum TaxID=1526571 RepID=A0ABQ1RA78_9ALTE|nr:sodium:proton antiporter [Lacimicrobium alkaliphilum]GGD63714.1 sodium/hydrogen exchanger [Lacimicrobium alkaliphilum]